MISFCNICTWSGPHSSYGYAAKTLAEVWKRLVKDKKRTLIVGLKVKKKVCAAESSNMDVIPRIPGWYVYTKPAETENASFSLHNIYLSKMNWLFSHLKIELCKRNLTALEK